MGAQAIVKKKGSSVDDSHLVNPLYLQYEDELERIRTEGDLTLIKLQAERKKLAELETKVAEANKQLRERNAVSQLGNEIVNTKGSGRSKHVVVAKVNPTVRGKSAVAKQQLPLISQSDKDLEGYMGRQDQEVIDEVAKIKKLRTEERLKVAVAERALELQTLKCAIDETRRKRLDALATETQMLKDIQIEEEDIKRAQEEMAQLKQQAADVKSEVAASARDFDSEKQTFRLERHRLLTELEAVQRAEKQGASAQHVSESDRYSIFENNIASRRKQHLRLSKWKRANLEQKIVSFEQKKLLLDRIVNEMNVKNLSEFLSLYNDQERTKAEMFARIEAQTSTKAALNESIAQFIEDIARFTGAGDGNHTGNTEKSSVEVQKVIDANDVQIKRWTKDADTFAEAVKCLRDPVQDVYNEFFPDDHTEADFDSTVKRESCLMRQIGIIEERIMQLIMAKILEETEGAVPPNISDTLHRLRQYQGKREDGDQAALKMSNICCVEPPSTLRRKSNAPRSKEGKIVVEDEDEIHATDVAVVHSDTLRQKFGSLPFSVSSTLNVGAATSRSSPSPPARKNVSQNHVTIYSPRLSDTS